MPVVAPDDWSGERLWCSMPVAAPDDWSGEMLWCSMPVVAPDDWTGEMLCWVAGENTGVDVMVGCDTDGVGCEKAVE